MKTFSLGFILAFITCALLAQHVNIMTIKEFFESMIVILPSTFILIFICWQIIKWSHLYFAYKKRFCLLNNNWQCLLIEGAWGSGKTTHYEKHFQYIDNKPNIYISCFSASRSELIAQIIQQQFWCKLLTLNGLLAKLMESNWQTFMPKNRVVVFDDLERLHANQDSYLDLIGIIDYLKRTNNNQIILIADISKTPQIFNAYMERIIDEAESPILMSKNEFRDNLVKEPDELTKNLLDHLYEYYSSNKIDNLRIIKNIMPKVAKKLGENYEEFDEVHQIISGSLDEIIKLINKHYLFYLDNMLFKECVEFNNPASKTTYEGTEQETKLGLVLSKYSLTINDFICKNYNDQNYIYQALQPDFEDFLKSNIEAELKSDHPITRDYELRLQNLVIQYLDKYISRKTKNNFGDGDYALLLLYVLHHPLYQDYEYLFEHILSSAEFMNPGNSAPLKTDEFSLLKLLRNVNLDQFKKSFKMDGLTEGQFLIRYYNFYRNKIINKFVTSIDAINYDMLYYFGTPWFKNNYNSLNYELVDEKIGVSALDGLYFLANRYINLVIIKEWIRNKVSIHVLLNYYFEVCKAFKNEINQADKRYIAEKINEFVNLQPIALRTGNSTEFYQDMELYSERYGSFDHMRDKLFKFKNMVAEYIKVDELRLQEFNQFNQENATIFENLIIERVAQ